MFVWRRRKRREKKRNLRSLAFKYKRGSAQARRFAKKPDPALAAQPTQGEEEGLFPFKDKDAAATAAAGDEEDEGGSLSHPLFGLSGWNALRNLKHQIVDLVDDEGDLDDWLNMIEEVTVERLAVEQENQRLKGLLKKVAQGGFSVNPSGLFSLDVEGSGEPAAGGQGGTDNPDGPGLMRLSSHHLEVEGVDRVAQGGEGPPVAPEEVTLNIGSVVRNPSFAPAPEADAGGTTGAAAPDGASSPPEVAAAMERAMTQRWHGSPVAAAEEPAGPEKPSTAAAEEPAADVAPTDGPDEPTSEQPTADRAEANAERPGASPEEPQASV